MSDTDGSGLRAMSRRWRQSQVRVANFRETYHAAPMAILLLIVVGTAAGFLATRLMKMETGLIPTIAIGVFGALIGAWAIRGLSTVSGGALAGFVGAVMGAMLLIWLWDYFRPKS